MGRVAEAALVGGLDKGTRGDRYQVVVHVDAEVLTEEDATAWQPPRFFRESLAQDVPAGTSPRIAETAEQERVPMAGASPISEDHRVPAGTSRRIACDASKVVMTHDSEGRVLDVGRRTRVIPPAIRRALDHRDRGCRFPGCGLRYCDAHHVKHWAEGGRTRLDNLVLLCRRHHRSVHEEGYQVRPRAAGGFDFYRPNGRPIPASPPPPRTTAEPLAALTERLVDAEVDVDAFGAEPGWDGSRLDLVEAMLALWRPASETGPGVRELDAAT
jgi:hypothetical protein